ncbi:MAG: nicotinamide-nucleotide adenylyltransferase [Thermoplasmata archaeon]
MPEGSAARVLLVGRFQPFHLGHLHMVRSLADDFDEVVLILGSSQASHTANNPFDLEERTRMIRETLQAEGVEGVRIVPVRDVGDHVVWLRDLLSLVPPFEAVVSHDPLTSRLFQEAGHPVLDRPLVDRETLSGTEVRRRVRAAEDWDELVPPTVRTIIKELGGEGRIRALENQ